MDPTVIRNAIRARPFQPFTLRLADGRDFTVPHPEFLALSDNGRTAVFMAPGGAIIAIDALLSVSLEHDAPLPPSAGNGSATA